MLENHQSLSIPGTEGEPGYRCLSVHYRSHNSLRYSSYIENYRHPV